VTQQSEEIGFRAIGFLRLFARLALAQEEIVLDPLRRGELNGSGLDSQLELPLLFTNRFLRLSPGGDVVDDPAIFSGQVISRRSGDRG